MTYNGTGNGPKENEADLNSMGNWAYSGYLPARHAYNAMTVQANPPNEQFSLPQERINQAFTHEGYRLPPGNSARNQQPQVYAQNMYTPQQAQMNTQQYEPQYASPSSSDRSYAAVAAQGRGQRSRPNYIPPNQAPVPQQQAAARSLQQAAQAGPAPGNAYQPQSHQGPSYAQVAATGQQQTMSPGYLHHGTTPFTTFGDPTAFQQSLGMGHLPYSAFSASQYPDSPHGSWQAVPPANDDWMLDPNTDFPLFEESMARFMNDSEPFVPTKTLNVDTSRSVPPTQLLMSPTDSIDAASTTSSMRRSKKEIMQGNSGPHKCQHCPAGFNNSDDKRHHEHRVHLPYSARPWPCPHCNYRAVLKKDLGRHLPKHGDRAANAQYFCPVRGCKYAAQGFIRKDHFNRHVEIHRKADSAIQMSRSTSAGTFSQR